MTMERQVVDLALAFTKNALTERQAAAHETLPQRRLQHERSAERWEDMARQAEEVLRQTVTNAESKRANPYPQSFRHRAAPTAEGATGA